MVYDHIRVLLQDGSEEYLVGGELEIEKNLIRLKNVKFPINPLQPEQKNFDRLIHMDNIIGLWLYHNVSETLKIFNHLIRVYHKGFTTPSVIEVDDVNYFIFDNMFTINFDGGIFKTPIKNLNYYDII